MSREHLENIGFVARLVRKQRALRKSPVQFTLSSLLLGMGYLACLMWLVQFIVRTEPLGIPLSMHLWFLVLWTCVIGGAFVSQDARWYLVGGLIGLGISSPILLMIFIEDLEPMPLLTGWACSFVFAMFANLGGGIWCFRNRRERLAVLNIATFVITFAMLTAFFSD